MENTKSTLPGMPGRCCLVAEGDLDRVDSGTSDCSEAQIRDCWRLVSTALILFLAFFFPLNARAQGTIANGALASGTLAKGGSVSWTFSANVGNGIMIRVGTTNFTPRIKVFGPSNESLADVASASSFNNDNFVTLQAASSGTYTVVISPNFASQSGSYGLNLAVSPGDFIVPDGDEGGSLQNGALNSGKMPLGDLDMWSFTANAGDSLMLRAGTTNFTPWIRLYGPDGALVSEVKSASTFNNDNFLSATATNVGTYTVVVTAAFVTQSGSYGLSLAIAPGSSVISNGDEGGTLQNGAFNSGKMPLGDLDIWNFTANAGDSLMLRAGTTNFTPWIRLYGPDGALVSEVKSTSTFNNDNFLIATATNAGTYTVVVTAAFVTQSGSYGLSLAVAPGSFVVPDGDEGGALQNGALNYGKMPLGDLDMWNFTANAGDSLMLRMGTTNFTPWIRLYGPDGALVAEAKSTSTFNVDNFLTVTATNAGTYTVVVTAAFVTQSGSYGLTLAVAPGSFVVSNGDEGGLIQNGVSNSGEIPLGDLDMWNFTANAGSGLILRMGATNFTPWIRLFGPDGALVAEAKSTSTFNVDNFLTVTATNAGVYTVVVGAAFVGQAGSYALNVGIVPATLIIPNGDQGGSLANGATNSAVMTLGDIDIWSFVGSPGDSNVLSVAATGFTPWIRLYNPAGALVAEVKPASSFTVTAMLPYEITSDPGIYTVVVMAAFVGQSGTYTFKQSRWAPDLIVPETQTLDEGETLSVSISAQDPDAPVTPVQFKLISAPPGVSFALAGATNGTISWVTTEADGPSTNVIVASVTDVVHGRSFTRTNSFTVIVREINVAPQLIVPSDITIDELTPLHVSAGGTDVDIPTNALTYSLLAAPDGMTIDPNTGAISWIPTEAQGPSVNPVTVVVTDFSPSAANSQHLSTTNSFSVTVREVNTPPRLTVPPAQTLDELTPLKVFATAADDDLPANPLTFSLESFPAGMTIDAVTGEIDWTPSEGQGPSTNSIVVVVKDSSPAAVNTQQFSVTNSFTVIVREVNSAPVLPVQTNLVIDELKTLTVTNTATDSDLPANILTYVLVSAPTNAVIDANGIITWTPTEEQGPSTNVFTTIVTDNGTPVLKATNSFSVTVNEVNIAPTLPAQIDRVIDELSTLSVTNTANDLDIPANSLSYSLVGAPDGADITPSGIITWTPSEPQGPSTNTFTTVVTDDGNPNLSVTNTFQVVVNEVNVAPVLDAINAQSVHYGILFSLQPVASDVDVPTNTLTFSLAAFPPGMVIDPSSGLITWTPLKSQSGSNSVTLRVTDNGTPARSATAVFQVTVTGDESRLAISSTSGLIQVTATGDTGFNYELQRSTDLQTWEKIVQFTSSYTYIEPPSEKAAARFFQIKLVQ